MDRPKVGMGVAILKDGKVLLHKRRSDSHGHDTWAFPGGHLESGESLEDCARRETLEEAGIRIKNIRFGTVTNDIFDEGTLTGTSKHYITLIMLADWDSGEPRVMEPDKAERWEWFAWDELPEPLFLPLENLVKQGFNPTNINPQSKF
jgi:8-oxo-dGTP diphosphatase